MHWARRITGYLIVSSVLAGAAFAGYTVYDRHQTKCAPSRHEAAELSKQIAADATQGFPTPDLSTPGAFEEALSDIQSKAQADTAVTAEYFTVVVTNASCFDDDEVASGRLWLRQQERRDQDVQKYWYCWDSGPNKPHHLGRRVAGDHLCTWGELRQAGMVG
ncbi:hypothetical protein QA942_16545 [Streptomyces sp. B21-106]|uniref:hypothetical protein n=1 Tax=Streptomyces sp. B21-106 TaxID=3039418 RepID=UPI002FF0BBFD